MDSLSDIGDRVIRVPGELGPGLTWNPTDYTIAYDGRPLGATDDVPFVSTGLIFIADDGKP
jgi:hypothetical protein